MALAILPVSGGKVSHESKLPTFLLSEIQREAGVGNRLVFVLNQVA